MQKFYAVIDTNVIISRLIKSANQDDTIIKLITGNEKHFNFDLDFIVRPKEMLNIIENSLKEEHEKIEEDNENQECKGLHL